MTSAAVAPRAGFVNVATKCGSLHVCAKSAAFPHSAS